MSPQELLDASIVEPSPPFPGIDELITRERRRERARRVGTALAGTAGMVAVVLAVTLVTGQLGGVRPPDGSPHPPATSAPSGPYNAELPSVALVRRPLLSMLFTTRLSTSLPSTRLVRGGGSAGVLPGGSGFGNEGDYLFLGAEAVVDPSAASEDVTRFSVTVFEPLTDAPLPTDGTLGALYGGCADIWDGDSPPARDSECDERPGPGGATISHGWRNQQGHIALIAVMAFPDGVAVRIEAVGEPSAVPVTAENLADVIADPRFVIPAWGSPNDVRTIPAQADWAPRMVNCLAPNGWDVRVSGGGFTSEVPAEEHDQYELDAATCAAQLEYGRIVTPSVANSWYDKLVASADCLRGQGYSISVAPSRQAYVEQLAAEHLPDWDPYVEVFDTTGGPVGVREAQSACPAPTSW